jgi:hypothetical protein
MKTINELDGVLRDCVGTCVYNVEYDALVCRVFEKEVLRGQVQPTFRRLFSYWIALSLCFCRLCPLARLALTSTSVPDVLLRCTQQLCPTSCHI